MNETLHLPMAQSAVDRDYLSRNRPDLFDELWANPKTRILVLFEGKTLLSGPDEAPEPALKLLTTEQVPSAQLRAYLGVSLEDSENEPAGSPIVLAVLSKNSADQVQPNEAAWHNLRRTGGGLDARDSGLYAQALALSNWHDSHQHCPKCGTPTVIEQGGWVRRCFKDDSEIYPRTDPAIICSVIDQQDRILLGSQGIWEDNRWSVLAGFVEPGESLNATVTREMFEEAGVRVINPQYLGSQSWPFPFSLMVGFSAQIDPDHAHIDEVPDGIEIEKLRWFTREEIAAEASKMLLPTRISIARAMIEHWYGGQLISATELNAK